MGHPCRPVSGPLCETQAPAPMWALTRAGPCVGPSTKHLCRGCVTWARHPASCSGASACRRRSSSRTSAIACCTWLKHAWPSAKHTPSARQAPLLAAPLAASTVDADAALVPTAIKPWAFWASWCGCHKGSAPVPGLHDLGEACHAQAARPWCGCHKGSASIDAPTRNACGAGADSN